MNMHLRGIWTHIRHVHALSHQLAGICALSLRKEVDYSVLVCSQDKEQQTTCIYYKTTYGFFFRHFFRGLMKLVAAIGKAVCLISVYKSQWTSNQGVIGLVMEVRVLGTPFTRICL
jgi:hypothetical protein